MKNYVFLFYAGGSMPNVPMEEIVSSWKKWFAELGESLVDGGNPFNQNGQAVTADSVDDIKSEDWPASGYTIVKAESMDAAVKLSQGCPMHSHHEGKAVVRVYEAMPM